jgi:tetratricopeptide (TPR) repeat protein
MNLKHFVAFTIITIAHNIYMRILFTLKFLALIFLTEATVAQDKKEFRKSFLEAEYFFMNEYYEEASFLYQQLLNADPLNYNLHFLLGACYLSIDGQKIKAIPHLEKAVSSISAGYREGSYREKNAPRETLFALARAYHINHQFSEAIEYYGKYKTVMKITDTDELDFVDLHIKAVKLATEQIRNIMDYDYMIMGESFNNKNSRAVFSEKDSTMVFMTIKPFYSAIMMSKLKNGVWSDPKILNEDLNLEGQFNLCAISYDGRELYLSIRKEYNWDLYVSYFEDGRWSPVQVLSNEINTEYNETHASITRDKRRLYFTSDRPGGEGARDIYYSDSDEYGKWGKPTNIGKPVNTRYSEETPFVTADGKGLFFSSMGHATIGGFDIFHSTILPNGKWSSPANIGYPLSSCDDDLFFMPIADGKHALYTSSGGLLPPGRIMAVNLDPGVEEPNFLSATTKVELEIPVEGQEASPLQADDISDEILAQISFVELTSHSVDESTIPVTESPAESFISNAPSVSETVSQEPPSEGNPTTQTTEGNTIHPAIPAVPVSSVDQKSGIDIATPTIAETEINTSPYTDTHVAQATPSEEVTISNTLEMEPVHQTSPAEPVSLTDKGSSTDILPPTASEPSGNYSQRIAESITQAEPPGIVPATGSIAEMKIPEATAVENDLQKSSGIKISTTEAKPEPENLKNEMEVKPDSHHLIPAVESSDPVVKPDSYHLIPAANSGR